MTIERRDLAFAALGVVLVGLIWLASPTMAERWTAEDGAVENLTLVLYLAAIAVASWALIRGRPTHRGYLILWIVLSVVFVGEEMSWGQRIFGFSTPAALSDNVQGETNIHNLPWLTPRVVEGPADLLTSQGLFYLGFFGYFLAVPLALRLPASSGIRERIKWPGLPWTTIAAIWTPIVFSFVAAALTSIGPTRDAHTEMRELLFAAAILIYVAGLVQSPTSEPSRA
jgi:hypothetical protein